MHTPPAPVDVRQHKVRQGNSGLPYEGLSSIFFCLLKTVQAKNGAPCLGLYALHEGFQSSEDSICCARRISIPWSGKALKRSSRLRIPTESASEYQTGDLYARVQVQCHLSLTLIWE